MSPRGPGCATERCPLAFEHGGFSLALLLLLAEEPVAGGRAGQQHPESLREHGRLSCSPAEPQGLPSAKTRAETLQTTSLCCYLVLRLIHGGFVGLNVPFLSHPGQGSVSSREKIYVRSSQSHDRVRRNDLRTCRHKYAFLFEPPRSRFGFPEGKIHVRSRENHDRGKRNDLKTCGHKYSFCFFEPSWSRLGFPEGKIHVRTRKINALQTSGRC